MQMSSSRPLVPLLLLGLGLTACSAPPSNVPPMDGAVAPDGGAGAAFCARTRSLNCPGAASCTMTLDPAAIGVPAACRAQWSAFVTCLDANAATITCAAVERGVPPVCMSAFTAAETCGRMAQDGGSGMSDASDAAPPDAAPSLPAPNAGEWMADVTFTLTGGNLMTPNVATGAAFLAPGALGAPAGAYTLSFQWENFLGSVGGNANCRVGVLYNSANSSYTFSGNNLLTQPCVIDAMGEAATTLTFTGASVTRSVGGALRVSVDVSGAGPRFSGAGRLELLWPLP